jgi:hypothetical protein
MADFTREELLDLQYALNYYIVQAGRPECYVAHRPLEGLRTLLDKVRAKKWSMPAEDSGD